MSRALITAVVIFALLLVPARAFSWDFSRSSIPVDQIQSGGPPRDGIPALFDPALVNASEAGFLSGDDLVLGVEVGGIARAYPVRILSWHELVNDEIAGSAILVSW
jgi:hypothetical protein